ncbi:hypothetical protein K438DRAFT_1625980 [Mycena galopus ATCC 62051]|nr:hypothetical protein K438DRAFT_1625980 [Mycena galopus ATCC 62051]
MYFPWAYTAIISSALLAPLVAASDLARGVSIDVCGEVDAELKLPSLLFPFNSISVGVIKACLCISTIPQYIAENELIFGFLELFGEKNIVAELTNMVNNCAGHSQCQYPAYSVPSCQSGSPCYFTCTNGYSAYPSGSHPTQCVCSSPYSVCNGKCGVFRACPSTYYAKRDLSGPQDCSAGQTACPIPGRGAKSWECIDTQSELESCGGCIYSDDLPRSSPHGKDCTAIPGVSDVSCVKGQCVIRKCISGYNLVGTSSECVYSMDHSVDQDPILLASQYGTEENEL